MTSKQSTSNTTKCESCKGSGKVQGVVGNHAMKSDICNPCNGLGWWVGGERLNADRVLMYYRDKVRSQNGKILNLQRHTKEITPLRVTNPYDGSGD